MMCGVLVFDVEGQCWIILLLCVIWILVCIVYVMCVVDDVQFCLFYFGDVFGVWLLVMLCVMIVLLLLCEFVMCVLYLFDCSVDYDLFVCLFVDELSEFVQMLFMLLLLCDWCLLKLCE